jgi:hypothetical protein
MALDFIHLPDPPCIPGLVGCGDGGSGRFGLGIVPLPAPPCIPGLIGCDATDEPDTNEGLDMPNWNSDTSKGGVNIAKPTSEPSAVDIPRWVQNNSNGNTAESAAASSPWTGDKIGTASPPLRGAKNAIAQYTLTLRNRGTEALKGVKALHGPLPFGAVFEPSRSSSGCTQVGNMVECVTDLLPGESKDLTVGYTVSNAVSCAIARSFQSAKVVAIKLSGEASNDASASVRCSMLSTVSPPISMTADTSDSASGSSVIGTGAVVTVEETTITTSAQCDSDSGNRENCVVGEEPLPRTGVDMGYFRASVVEKNVLAPFAHSKPVSLYSGGWFILASTIVIVTLVTYLLYFSKLRKTFN